MDESMNERFFHLTEDTTLAEAADKPMTRAQKKNVRKKQKKKEKRSAEVAFEIEEIITGVGNLSFSDDQGTGASNHSKKQEEKVTNTQFLYVHVHVCATKFHLYQLVSSPLQSQALHRHM